MSTHNEKLLELAMQHAVHGKGDLVTALVYDDIAVAYPVLVHNQTLDDGTLIEVIEKR
jgi:uncharacterized protein (DUF2336 family)